MKLDFCVNNYTQRDLLLLVPPSSTTTTTTIALKFHPKHVTNKNKTKHIMKISHISFI
jgi:hypothetical protein